MDKATPPLAIIGELVELPEDSYLYGVGPLILRVTKVAPAHERGWVTLSGHVVAWNGQRTGDRSVVAKTAAIRLVRHPA